MKTIIQTPTSSLSESVAFYQKLNFEKLSEEKSVFFSDGKFIMEVNPDRFSRAGIKLYRKSWTDVLANLKAQTNVMTIEGGFLLSDPSGCWIYLMESEEEFVLSEERNTILGNLAGLSLESMDMKKSYAIFSLLGFKKTMGDEASAWLAMTNEDGVGVSIMKPMNCPHLFFNPSLTYFNSGKNPEVIEKIRDLKIAITEEITHFNKEGLVDNIIIRDPGGFGFFLFND